MRRLIMQIDAGENALAALDAVMADPQALLTLTDRLAATVRDAALSTGGTGEEYKVTLLTENEALREITQWAERAYNAEASLYSVKLEAEAAKAKAQMQLEGIQAEAQHAIAVAEAKAELVRAKLAIAEAELARRQAAHG